MSKRDYGAGTHTGCVRQRNEDCYGADPQVGLWLIADGMGGHHAGEVASTVVVQSVLSAVKQGIPVARAVAHSHQAILDVLKTGKGAYGMGSTAVVLKMDGNDYEIAWIGDSRAYLWSNGALRQLTRDHTLVQCLLDAGIIDAQQASVHPQRHQITQALGPTEMVKVEIDTISGTLQPGEQILLCSDGLTNDLNEVQIAAILSKNLDVQQKVNQLIQAALDAGGKDNITVLLIPAQEETILDIDDTQSISCISIDESTQAVRLYTTDS